jgi:murein DD-endopeptidase MepM/ murein hydrolase activator NlpD
MSARLRRATEITAVFSVRDHGRPAQDSARLVALQVGSGPTAKRAFRVEDAQHRIDGFYSIGGTPIEGEFLRYPINYMLITSPFSLRRHHPILKSRRPHRGVDLAAPRGTPVLAVADGEVVEATWSGPLGRTIGIRHDDDYATGYSHLERIAPGIEIGARVRKGEVIGYVGKSGLATGPHLHFSMLRGNAFVDPLAAQTPRLPRLSPLALSKLQSAATQLIAAMDTTGRNSAPTLVANGGTRRVRDNARASKIGPDSDATVMSSGARQQP